MNILFTDTETTGKWDFKASVDAPHQPHIIQLAAILDRDGRDATEFETLVHLPADVRIDEGALRTHGITAARALEEGMPLREALTIFQNMVSAADLLVCHNTDFDLKVLLAAYARAGLISHIPSMRQYCTMRASTDVCRIPGKYGYKWPKLDEAYRVLVDPSGFEGAHSALADVRACRALYYALQQREQRKETETGT